MPALSIIIDIILILVSICLIAVVLLQEGQREGLGAISGGAETFFGKNKASSAEGKLKFITKILAAVFIVLAIVATIITAHINNTPATTPVVDAEATEEPADTEEDAEATEAPAEGEADAEATEAPTEDDAEATEEPEESADDAEATEAPAEDDAEATEAPTEDDAADDESAS